MSFRSTVSALCIALPVLWAGDAGAQTPANPYAGINPMAMGGEMPAARTLAQAEVDRYLTALQALVSAGVNAERELGGMDPNDMRARATAIKYSEKMRGIVASHGFDEKTFSEVHWNLMLAYAANEMGQSKEEIAAAKKEQQAAMAQMKASLSPAQYEAMMQSMASMSGLMKAYEDVPEVNKQLAAKNKARLEAILDSAR